MVRESRPRVSIGLPVYNGEKFLNATIDSLLAQTFPDFEIVISDNASTDRTEEICRAYATADPRVRYVRVDVNRGAGWNYNHVFDLARGDYFKWQAHDDLLAPEFLEKCVAVLDRDPSVVLCYCDSAMIDETGQQFAVHSQRSAVDAPRPSQRFVALLQHGKSVGCEIFGLMRMETLQKAPRQGCFAHADNLFLCHLALFGRFYQIPEPLFLFREHASQSMQTLPGHLSRRSQGRFLPFTGPLPATDWWDPTKKGCIDFPNWRFYKLNVQFIHQFPLSPRERLRCYGGLLKQLLLGKDALRLVIDLLLAIEKWLLTSRRVDQGQPSLGLD